MPRLTVFNSVTLDGYFTGPGGDMSWAHKSDPEWNAFVYDNAAGGGRLLFGRVTYDMMASFWPTEHARQLAPQVAEHMNVLPKVVFSRTLKAAAWSNTTLVQDDLVGAVRRMKVDGGPDMVILGSGTIVAQLAAAHLIDEYQIALNPTVLGRGRTMFEGVKESPPLKLMGSRAFGNGNVVLSYEALA
jgi:dihydrofolate reductase